MQFDPRLRKYSRLAKTNRIFQFQEITCEYLLQNTVKLLFSDLAVEMEIKSNRKKISFFSKIR